jgi:glycosyltransferase involved in cell wall biosynthesis
VISTGIDLPVPLSHETSGALSDGGGPHPSPTVGTVGLRPIKRPERFLEIFERVRQRVPHARALMIGGAEPEELARLRLLAAKLGVEGAVEFPGQQPDLRIWYPRMDVYAHCSKSEALPKVILEAMAHSLPVVAFEVGGISEAVAHKQTGYLCSEGDVNAFAETLTGLLSDSDRARQMGAAGRVRVEQRFSSRGMVARQMALFDEVISSRNRAVPSVELGARS